MDLDLKFYAEKNCKIPTQLLEEQVKSNELSLARILGAHFIDFHLVFYFSLIILTVMENSLSQLIVTRGQLSFYDRFQGDFTLILFPLALAGYFFFCHYFNQGQTYGMFLLKSRVTTPVHSWRYSLRWTCYSLIVCTSLGLLAKKAHAWFEAQGFGKIGKHDYLYLELMGRNIVPTSVLVTTTPLETREEESYSVAA